ncbi:MAG: response regulator [Clostridiales Family XIII bacterium]|nr:response regulator [Clostridiales Family XIII bacterium]
MFFRQLIYSKHINRIFVPPPHARQRGDRTQNDNFERECGIDSRLKVLLIEDDTSACQRIAECIEKTDDVSLVSITDNSFDAVGLVEEHAPDAIILDLELHHGAGSGLIFLQKLVYLNLPKPPFILITTNNVSQITYNHARSLGADYILSKHQQDYSEQAVVDLLRLLKDSILQHTSLENKGDIYQQVPVHNGVAREKRITDELEKVGVNPKSLGYQYLIDAISLIMDNHATCVSDKLALRYDKSSQSITHAMQNAIRNAWRFTDTDELYKHYTAKFNLERGCPTMMEFIYYYASKLKDPV